jgi:acyl-CoA synthetase (AMP-forming)/AMP-acid ligase II
MVLGTLAAMVSGTQIVLPSAGFHAYSSLEAMSKYECTAMYGVPTMFNDVIRE